MKDSNHKFVVTPKSESVTMTIRIQPEVNERLEILALQSGRSRNELINMALSFALNNLEFVNESGDAKK